MVNICLKVEDCGGQEKDVGGRRCTGGSTSII